MSDGASSVARRSACDGIVGVAHLKVEVREIAEQGNAVGFVLESP